MGNNKKFSKANLLYFFSMMLGLTIIILGFSVANSAKKELEKQPDVQQQVEAKSETKVVTSVAEKIIKEPVDEEVIVIKQKEDVPETDEFAPNLENYVITKPVDGKVSASFTGKSLIYSKYFDDWSVHKGIDIAADESAQVKAAANGRVKEVYKDNRLGIVIVLEHGDFTTIYGNLSTDKLVGVGDEVYAGDIISGVGKSPEGKAFLHFEISYKGEDIDPEPLLK